jgi:diguanylate cyclase (GGDEF)-like protein
VAQVLKNNTQRGSDFAFRLGGEEFGLIFSDLDEQKSKELAQHILDEIESLKIQHKENSASKYVTASAGLVIRRRDTLNDSNEIYISADKLLYEAKERGRNRLAT